MHASVNGRRRVLKLVDQSAMYPLKLTETSCSLVSIGVPYDVNILAAYGLLCAVLQFLKNENVVKELAYQTPMRRVGEPGEVSSAVAFLCAIFNNRTGHLH
ncbi:hypothetical protein DKX38_012770 [Salix brachista]|uniref:Uncharacterized protein n=1 Tax=Salix brachista TaxID=2182728 RepID=A0A5N5LPZ3_9ROSI|nr:hypothetical protein DKX38_012770 [Salix brachista]